MADKQLTEASLRARLAFRDRRIARLRETVRDLKGDIASCKRELRRKVDPLLDDAVAEAKWQRRVAAKLHKLLVKAERRAEFHQEQAAFLRAEVRRLKSRVEAR